MDRELVKSKVISIIEEYYSEGNPVDESNTPMDFDMDSLDLVELNMLIEEEFELKFPLSLTLTSPIDIGSDYPFSDMIDLLTAYINDHETGKL